MGDLHRQALARDLARRLTLASHEELRLVDRALHRLEQLRELRWERRLATGPGDVDPYFHAIARIERGTVVTECVGRWPMGDAVEACSDLPPIRELCGACLRRSALARHAEHSIDGLIAIAAELAQEDVARAELREQAAQELAVEQERPRRTLTAAARARLDAVVASYGPTEPQPDEAAELERWRANDRRTHASTELAQIALEDANEGGPYEDWEIGAGDA
jgi:hypothetical protein